MNKKILILCLFLLSCGYKPVYQNKNIKNLKFADIILNGNNEINRKIVNSLSIEKDKDINNKNKLYVTTHIKLKQPQEILKDKRFLLELISMLT